MEIQYYGANCLKITCKKGTFIVDDLSLLYPNKSIAKEGGINLITDVTLTPPATQLAIQSPGEYEVSDVAIYGIAAQRHIDDPGTQNGVIYKLVTDDFTVVTLGNVHSELSNEQLESIGMVDVLIVPVGGNGYTVDPIGALKIMKKIEPKVVIPTHYDDGSVAYEVPQQTLEQALKEMGIEASRTESKLKLKLSELPEQQQLWVLTKQ